MATSRTKYPKSTPQKTRHHAGCPQLSPPETTSRDQSHLAAPDCLLNTDCSTPPGTRRKPTTAVTELGALPGDSKSDHKPEIYSKAGKKTSMNNRRNTKIKSPQQTLTKRKGRQLRHSWENSPNILCQAAAVLTDRLVVSIQLFQTGRNIFKCTRATNPDPQPPAVTVRQAATVLTQHPEITLHPLRQLQSATMSKSTPQIAAQVGISAHRTAENHRKLSPLNNQSSN